MRFSVHHCSWYRYDVPVALGRHVLRLTPRPEAGRLEARELRITPGLSAQRSVIDAHGNCVVELEFVGECQELCVDSAFELETAPPVRPLGHLLPPLPWPVDPASPSLQLGYHGSSPVEDEVSGFGHAAAQDVGWAALPFLDRLTQALYEGFDRGVRPSGEANPAAVTLGLRSGACRDLTVLFMEVVRAQGMAARFVSGYQAHAETASGQRHLHAWPEVLIPGVGFCGWDPMHGVRVADGHVALCAGAEQGDTMPVDGTFTFNGPVVNSTLDYSLRIETR